MSDSHATRIREFMSAFSFLSLVEVSVLHRHPFTTRVRSEYSGGSPTPDFRPNGFLIPPSPSLPDFLPLVSGDICIDPITFPPSADLESVLESVEDMILHGEDDAGACSVCGHSIDYGSICDPCASARYTRSITFEEGFPMTSKTHSVESIVAELDRASGASEAPNFSFSTIRDLDLSNLDFTGADFSHSYIYDTKFIGATLSGASFSHASVIDSNFRRADMSGSVFRDASSVGSTYRKADFRDADLSDATFCYDDLVSADLSGSNFSNTLFRDSLLNNTLGGFLQVNTPAGDVIVAPTPKGWTVSVDAWSGTVDEFATFCDDADCQNGALLHGVLSLTKAHITYHGGLVDELSRQWG